jgi:hypothetical protein
LHDLGDPLVRDPAEKLCDLSCCEALRERSQDRAVPFFSELLDLTI